MFTLIGSIKLFPYDFDPQGWKSCDGGEVSLFDSETLFQLLGNTFGGDVNRETFGVPNLKAPQGCRYCISLVGSYPQGRDDGALLGETVIWAVPNIRPSNLVECNG